ncbi:MAG: hypothetical protein ACI8Z5_001639 [Lentimonas sp.]|jgi:hypothetical protein
MDEAELVPPGSRFFCNDQKNGCLLMEAAVVNVLSANRE